MAHTTHTYRLTIEYDGTGYSGWQMQKNALSIQGTLIAAAQDLFGADVDTQGAGRTDAGVHALAQVAHLCAPRWLPPQSLLFGLNDLHPRHDQHPPGGRGAAGLSCPTLGAGEELSLPHLSLPDGLRKALCLVDQGRSRPRPDAVGGGPCPGISQFFLLCRQADRQAPAHRGADRPDGDRGVGRDDPI
jgi:hypothetical protein